MNAISCQSGSTDQSLLNHVEFWARRIGRAFRLSDADLDDVRQELSLVVIGAMRRHDRSRACAETFANRVLDRHCRYLRRRLIARGQRKALCPQSLASLATEPAENDPGLGEINEEDGVRIRIDVEAVMARLPEPLQRICEALMVNDPSEVAQQLGLHRSTIYRRIRQIRCRLIEAGIDNAV